MFSQEGPVRREKQYAAIERPAITLDDTDNQVDGIVPRGMGKFIDRGPRNIHAAVPIAAEIFAALFRARADHRPKIEPPWVAGDKSFGEKYKLGALAPRFAREDLDFLQGSLAIEYNRRSLNHGYLETLWRRLGCLLFGIVIRHDVNDTASGLRFKWRSEERRVGKECRWWGWWWQCE